MNDKEFKQLLAAYNAENIDVKPIYVGGLAEEIWCAMHDVNGRIDKAIYERVMSIIDEHIRR